MDTPSSVPVIFSDLNAGGVQPANDKAKIMMDILMIAPCISFVSVLANDGPNEI